jgi:hypothetical protein
MITDAGFQIVTAMDSTVFRDVAPSILIKAYRRFGGTYHVNIESRRVGHEATGNVCKLLHEFKTAQRILRIFIIIIIIIIISSLFLLHRCLS